MNTNKKEIEILRGMIGEKIIKAEEKYAKYSPMEKFVFVQQAFNEVNQLCSKMWNYKPSSVPFGFIIGRRAAGVTMNLGKGKSGVALNANTVLSTKDPAKIYEIIFHEMKHVHQNMTKTLGTRLEKLYIPSHLKGGILTKNEWLASPKEIEADKFATSQMVNLYTKGGIIKHPYRVKSPRQHKFFKQGKLKNFVEHIKGIAKLVINPFGRLFGKGKVEATSKESPKGVQLFNLKEINDIYTRFPNEMGKGAPEEKSNIIRGYLKARGEKAHTMKGYFANGALHQKETIEALAGLTAQKSQQTVVQQVPENNQPPMGRLNNFAVPNNAFQSGAVAAKIEQEYTQGENDIFSEVMNYISARTSQQQTQNAEDKDLNSNPEDLENIQIVADSAVPHIVENPVVENLGIELEK